MEKNEPLQTPELCAVSKQERVHEEQQTHESCTVGKTINSRALYSEETTDSLSLYSMKTTNFSALYNVKREIPSSVQYDNKKLRALYSVKTRILYSVQLEIHELCTEKKN